MKGQQGWGSLIKWIVVVCDLIVINGVFFLVDLCVGNTMDSFYGEKSRMAILLLNLTYFFAINFFPSKMQNPIIYIDEVVRRAFSLISLHAIIFITCLFFLYSTNVPAHFIFVFYLVLYVVFVFWRILGRKLLKDYRRAGYNYKEVVIVGGGKSAADLYKIFVSDQGSGYKLLGFFVDNQVNNFDPKYPSLGTIDAFDDFILNSNVSEVYCTLPYSESATITRILNFCEKNTIKFFFVPEYSLFVKKSLLIKYMGNVPVLTIRPEPLQYIYNRIVKRGFDIMFSSIFLITVFPIIFLIISIGIKLTSPGPIFFKQLRTGRYGNDFYCYKFRSMHKNEEADLKQASKGDPRITKIGAFMRSTNLDELPQFINVLKGDMSLVGPRPHMVSQTNLYTSLIDQYMIRHTVLPGVTGWAQITGSRGEIQNLEQMEERVKKDVWYIENWSFLFDLKIIAMTALSMLKKERKNAY